MLNTAPERRFGVNRGGEYFRFDVFGAQLLLLRNEGEARVDEHSERYYLLVYEAPAIARRLAERVATLCRTAGLGGDVDDAAA